MTQTTDDKALEQLEEIRRSAGQPRTTGLDRATIEQFLSRDPSLGRAIASAHERWRTLDAEERDLLSMEEGELCDLVQRDFVNFYPAAGINPYVPLAAQGPWIVTTHGAVVHDSGGYGMLGLGHNPDDILAAMGRPMVMANVMTPNLAQRRLGERLRREIGRARGSCPLPRFVCLNSGSEAVTLTARVVDVQAKQMTDPGGAYPDRSLRTIAVRGGFHGRTYRAAQLSESTRDVYRHHLASFRDDSLMEFVTMNDVEDLERAFAQAEKDEVFVQAVYLEPVMGEGLPGVPISREFYDAARRLASSHGSLLVVDSIQAALRAQGCLSLVDYPGFEDCEAPDMETFSKALNAGQYPLSVIAMREEVADLYVTGIYGNTMTTNPKALSVACEVLDALDDELRDNIRRMGAYFKKGLEDLARRHDAITRVDGTGLIVAAHLDPARYQVTGEGGLEETLRRGGIEMIHGGENAVRFTPHFAITEAEVDLILRHMERALG